MKDLKLVLSTLFLLIITLFNAQIKNPVKFKFDINAVGKDEYEGQFFGFQKPFDQLWNCSAKTG